MTTALDSSRISPTAHYTGFVWCRNGISHPVFQTRRGWLLYNALRPMNYAYRRMGGVTLEGMLLARHQVIDQLLSEAIESGRVGQVVEVAAGLSPRGYRFATRYRDRGLRYVEGDLPDMVRQKRAVLAAADLSGDNHHVVELNALADDGEVSIVQVGDRLLDPNLGTAVITEGLLGYFSPDDVRGMWRRFAGFLDRYPSGLYLSDLNLAGDAGSMRGTRAFQKMLSVFARGQVYLHFDEQSHAAAELEACGFARAGLHDPKQFADQLYLDETARTVIRVIEAATNA